MPKPMMPKNIKEMMKKGVKFDPKTTLVLLDIPPIEVLLLTLIALISLSLFSDRAAADAH